MEKTYTVYKHTTPSNKVYIGITSKPVSRRYGNNGAGYKKNVYFFRAIQKYGWKNITHEIVAEGLTKENACEMEMNLIAEYDSTNPTKGYNNSTGGESGSVGTHRTEEQRKRMSEVERGEKNHWYGKHLSEETKRKISEAHKGMHPSKQSCIKMSESRKGKKHSDEWNRHISDGNKGKKLSEETRKKISTSRVGTPAWNKKKVLCIETGIIYESVDDAMKKTGFSNRIGVVCRGDGKTAGGYHWKYVEGEEEEE